MIGIDPKSVSRILNTPKGRDMMLDMQAKQVELAIDPIQQKLAEYADEAALKLHDLLEADAENVQRMAAKDILEMAGYTPKRNAQEVKEVDTTIIVGQMNIGEGASPTQIKESILENSGARYTPIEEAGDEQYNGRNDGQAEQRGDEQEQAEGIELAQHDQNGRRERSEDGIGVQLSDESAEIRIKPSPGTRWLSNKGGNSTNDGDSGCEGIAP
tara:strand:- start:6985 stop:7626 length:642 start_codon:yes stop_codon:yes gene_type:complete